LKQAGLTLVAAYAGANFIFPDVLAEELSKIEAVAESAAAHGAEHLVVGGGAKRRAGARVDDYKRLSDGLEQVVSIAQKRGLKAHYHPHLTTLVEGPDEVDKIFSLTSIDFCPDTAHLAAGGCSVPALIRKHHARISYVHLKGWRREPFTFTPLDEGDLDIASVVRALADIQFQGWITAELDSWPDPLEGAKRSRTFLQQHVLPA
jgi:inosose dehydratase